MSESTTPEAPGLPAGAAPMGTDGWVVLRDYHELLGSDVKAVRGAVKAGATPGAATVQMQEKLIELLVRNWSRADLPLPATAAVSDRLTAPEYAALVKLVNAALALVLGTGIAPSMSQAAMNDPASPTGPSSE